MIRSIKKLMLAAAVMTLCIPLFAQKPKSKPASSPQQIKVAMSAGSWEFPAGSAEFVNHRNMPAMKLSGPTVVLKEVQFTDGTIEYDLEPQTDGFTGIYFRMADDKDAEYFYLRVGRAGNPAAMDAVQYAPIIKDINMWDMLDHYQGPAVIKKGEWNHIKLVISGKQMLIYVNDLSKATLQIARLEGNTSTGSIAFDGKCVVANLVVKPGAVEGLSASEGIDPTYRDPRYLRAWQVTEPQPLPKGRELFDGDFPKVSTEWKAISAERLGLVNLTRLHGRSESRRFVWLRTKLVTTAEQTRTISLGFSDEVWVYINRQPVFVDKNLYISQAMRKYPDGRISIENSKFELPLKAGENELLIGVANDFFGWGLIARLDKMEGITATSDFPPPPALPSDLSGYLGTYKTAEAAEKMKFTFVDGKVMCEPEGQGALEIEYFEKDKFKIDKYGAVFEFNVAEKTMVLRQGGMARTYIKE